ncbi:MAG: phosphatidate cytidylyltransferase [Bacteroidota bacterium]
MSILNHFIPQTLLVAMGIIFGFLTICSTVFWGLHRRKPSDFFQELITRTRSWWFIALGIAIVVLGPPLWGTILIGYVAFVALREMFSISGFRESDRPALFVAYFTVPVQFYFAYTLLMTPFYVFIPMGMFVLTGFILVLGGNTVKIGRSMPLIPTLVMLTVYMLSHLVLLYHQEFTGYTLGGGGLILYLVMLTAFNDVFQFTWGKMLGKRKILPSVSPNKTWEGFIGGVLSSGVLGWALHFLTPLEDWQGFVVGLVLSVVGFMGDAIMSAVKRDLFLKDTDDLIPGHGGAMDRLDSIVMTSPFFFHLLTFFTSV